jgi:hypothetical protein
MPTYNNGEEYTIGKEFFVTRNVLNGTLFTGGDFVFIEDVSFLGTNLNDVMYHLVSRSTGSRSSVNGIFLNHLVNGAALLHYKKGSESDNYNHKFLHFKKELDKECGAGHPFTSIFK